MKRQKCFNISDGSHSPVKLKGCIILFAYLQQAREKYGTFLYIVIGVLTSRAVNISMEDYSSDVCENLFIETRNLERKQNFMLKYDWCLQSGVFI